MLRFEIKIVIICIRSKPYFLHFRNFALGFHFFLFLLFLIEKFIIVYNLTNRGICLWGNFYKIQSHVICNSLSFCYGVYTYFYIFTNQSYLGHFYHMVSSVFLLLFFSETWIKCASRGSGWKYRSR